MLWLLALIAVALWLGIDSFYRIEPAQRGLVRRFGAFITVLEPGPHFRFPRPIEYVSKINVDAIKDFTVTATMLTGDENIVDVELVSQYRIKDANSYLFMTADPDDTVRQLTESSIREIIGTSNFDFVITEGRGEIAVQAQERIQQILDRYNAGIEVTSVNMQPAKPPDEVKASFDDAIKSREDEQRKINEAEAYRNEVVERAQGEAHRLRLESEGYREQVIARATGEARRFGQILVEYRKAPAVTRKRLYLEAIESVLSDTTKVMIDAKQSNNLTYLPLDRILNNAESARQSRDPAPQSGNSVTAPTADFGSSAARSREVR